MWLRVYRGVDGVLAFHELLDLGKFVRGKYCFGRFLAFLVVKGKVGWFCCGFGWMAGFERRGIGFFV